MAAGNLLYAQSGGVTAVINATASAVIETARRQPAKVKVLAARNGILGALREELIDTSHESRGRDPRAAPYAGRRLRLAAGSSSSRLEAEPRASTSA